MENSHDDYGFPMPSVSWAALEILAGEVSGHFFLETLTRPMAIDFTKLMNVTMEANRYFVCPVPHEEIGNRAGICVPTLDPNEHTILLREDLYDTIDQGLTGSSAHFAVGTLLHEFSHAVLKHDYRLGQLLAQPKENLLLARKRNTDIKAYESAEAQAWCLAGHLAMPRRTILMIPNPSIFGLSQIYGVSMDFVKNHLRRLKMILPEFEEVIRL